MIIEFVNCKIRIEFKSFYEPKSLTTMLYYTSKIRTESNYVQITGLFWDVALAPDKFHFFIFSQTSWNENVPGWERVLDILLHTAKILLLISCGVFFVIWFSFCFVLCFVFFSFLFLIFIEKYVFQPTCITSYLQELENKRLEN